MNMKGKMENFNTELLKNYWSAREKVRMRKNEKQNSVNDRAENVEGIDEDAHTIKVISGHKKNFTN